jgi:antitoxin (DNA-binding transcriptional repressor) of toxin-antitoxin stability system
MITNISVRELKDQTSHILQTVREDRAEYIITLEDEPVATLRPFTGTIASEEDARRLRQLEVGKSIAEMKVLARDVAEAWNSDKSGIELVVEQRR